MMISETKKTNRYAVLITYCLVVVCLILGLFLPLFGADGKGIPALQLPQAVNSAFGTSLGFGDPFTLYYPVTFGTESFVLDLAAIAVLLYALVCVIALLALIPVIIGTVKNNVKLSACFAYIAETAALIVLSFYLILTLYMTSVSGINFVGYGMVIALCGSAVMLIALNFICKGGRAAAKTVLYLLSAVGFLMMFSWQFLFPELDLGESLCLALFGNMSGTDNLYHLFNGIPYEIPGEAKYQAAIVLSLIVGLLAYINYFIDSIGLSVNSNRLGFKIGIGRYGLELLSVIALFITVGVCEYSVGLMLIVLAAAVLIQLAITVIRYLAFRKRAKATVADEETVQFVKPAKQKKQKVIDVEDEPVEIVEVNEKPANAAAPETVQMEIVEGLPERKPVEEPTPVEEQPLTANGEQLVISTDAPASAPAPAPAPAYAPAPAPAPTYAPNPVPNPAPAPAAQPIDVSGFKTQIYTINTIYGGPVDEFMRKLTNDERIEFAMTFIEKNKGKLGNIPEYVIGGNNRDFFSAVFIYLGRIRGLISDSLLNKMYAELNMM